MKVEAVVEQDVEVIIVVIKEVLVMKKIIVLINIQVVVIVEVEEENIVVNIPHIINHIIIIEIGL